jgi:hypothetical protein
MPSSCGTGTRGWTLGGGTAGWGALSTTGASGAGWTLLSNLPTLIIGGAGAGGKKRLDPEKQQLLGCVVAVGTGVAV